MSRQAAIAESRSDAETRFAAVGVPHRRIEAWHYTDLRARLDAGLPPAPYFEGGVKVEADPFAGVDALKLVIANGAWREDLSAKPSNPAVQVVALDGSAPDWARAALNQDTPAAAPMADLALARMAGGVAIRVSHNFKAPRPIHLAFLARGAEAAARHTRVVVVLESGAELTLLESHAGEGAAGLTNMALDVRLAANARLGHLKIAGGTDGETHIGTVLASVEAGAHYAAAIAAGDSAMARHEIQARLAQRTAQFSLTAFALLSGAQHCDVTAVVEHALRDGRSDLAFRSVLAGRSRSVAQGRIVVRPGADGTDSRQSTRALLLSKGAEADAKPELEIHAEDVACGHGAAIGDLDTDALFYLRARGIPEREARAMLTEAFLREGLDRLPEGAAADAMRGFVLARLHGLEGA